MNPILSFFRYATLVSIPLFSATAVLLMPKAKGNHYALRRETVSRMISFLDTPRQRAIYRLNFLVKALLDFGFVWFLVVYFHLAVTSSVSLFLVVSALLFGSLGYLTDDRYHILHKIAVYACGAFWLLASLQLAQLTNSLPFILFSAILSVTVMVLALWAMFARKTNVPIQAMCMILMYGWIAVFVTRYLR